MNVILIFLWMLTIINFVEIKGLSNVNIIHSFFKEKFSKHVTIFDCCKKNEKRNLAKKFMSGIQSVSIFSINENHIHKKLTTKYQHLGVILNADCPKVNNFLIRCGNLNYFDEKHHWLIVTYSNNILNRFKNVTLNINADIHVAISKANLEIWTIYDLYNPASKHGGVLNLTKIGYYDKNLGYKIKKKEAKYWARRNATGVTFKSLIVLPEPFKGKLENYLSSDEDRNINTFNRFHERLTSYCRDYYNYSVKLNITDSWGYTKPDATFDGMVGALAQKEIDFGSSPLFFREDRHRVIDYGRNTWILRAAFLFRNPKARTSIEIFLRPLPISVWLITAMLAIISIIILKIVTTFERNRYHIQNETSWSVSVLLTIAAFCQQGSPSTPRMTCGRITTISIFLLSILIYQFYSASLVSHLLMKPVTNIKSVKDILESSLKVGCENILYDKDYFEHTTDDIAIELYNKKILGKKNSSNYFSPEYGLKLVEQGGFAFHVETATAYPIIEATFAEKPICELREIQLFKTQPMHANYQKHSPFRELFDTCYQRLAEFGLLYRERTHWHPRKPECIQSSKSISFNVGLKEFYPALIILLFGILISLVILILEHQISVVRKKHETDKVQKQVFPFVE